MLRSIVCKSSTLAYHKEKNNNSFSLKSQSNKLSPRRRNKKPKKLDQESPSELLRLTKTLPKSKVELKLAPKTFLLKPLPRQLKSLSMPLLSLTNCWILSLQSNQARD